MDEQRKTKEKNTFRFKSFADRVNEIDIRRSALYYIGHENEELPEADETYFHQTVKKWSVLNLTDEYHQFSKKCQGIVTLPQLLHKKDFVVDLLLEKLSTASNLSLQPLLEILVVLGRDLREDFYPYFQRVLDRLICLLNTKDPDQLEWTLICLAYLFKTLKPFLKKNIAFVFHAILPLLDENRYSEDVTNFAVECFSFIARDLKDYNKLLDIILSTVIKEKTQSIMGCGRLFFEIVRGVKGLFHSVAEKFLEFLFESLLKADEMRKELLFDIISSAVAEILKFIHPHNLGLFWLVICRVIRLAVNENNASALNSLIQLMSQAAQWRDGRILSEMETVVPTILKVVDASSEEDCILLENLCTLVSEILLSSNAKISQLDTSRMIKKLMQVDQREIFESFVLRITTHTQFEILVLNDLLRYFEAYFDKQSLELLAQVILQKSPLVRNGQKLSEWKKYPLQMRKPETLKKLENIFEEFGGEPEREEEFLLALILSPHVTGLDHALVEKKSKELMQKVIRKLTDAELSKEKDLFILSAILENGIHSGFVWKNDVLLQLVSVVLPHCAQGKSALSIIDQIFTLKPNLAKTAVDVHEVIAHLLSSRSIEIRLLSSHCLHSIYKSEQSNPYKIFYDTECIEPTVHTYREQTLLLQKLEINGEFFKSIKEDRFKVDTLRFLMGMLYHNFKLLWDPVLKLIQDYSKVLTTADFWEVYKQKLEETADEIANIDQRSAETGEYLWFSSALSSLQADVIKPTTKQDLMNYRNLIWGKISTFGQIREIKNHDLVAMFLQFVYDEYKPNQQRRIYTMDITKVDDKQIQEDVDEDDDEEEEVTPKKSLASTKTIISTLISKMSMFVDQPNPKRLHRESELYAFYMELLAGNNAVLQKIALDCVMSYKKKSLAPYKDHLYAMIDEKKFKEELLSFKIDRSSGTIQEDHRKEFMQILLRILYGKMITKTTSKNVSTQVRKGIILRFLGGCTTEEILWFLKMAFGMYDQVIEGDLEGIQRKVKENFKPTSVWSPKKLQSTINLLELIRKQFGGLMEDEFLIYTLKLIIFVGAVCKEVITAASDEETKMHPKMATIFKNVKNMALLSLVNFFSHFDRFPWTESQVRTLADVFIWETVEKLRQDSIHSPTPVLKLLLRWGENPKLYGYLAISNKNGQTPFQFVVELLLNEKSKAPVRKPIMEMIERLLTVEGDEQKVPGIDVIKPHILQILKRLKMNFSSVGRNSRNRGSLDKRDLNILSLLTQHVDDSETCDSLLQLLLPILISKSQSSTSEDVVCQVITTLSNLIKKLDSPETYLRKIAPLFEQVHEVSARKMLCQLLLDIARKRNSESLKQTARIIGALNAWDKRWVEQPDYDKRLDAFKSIPVKLEEEETAVDIDLGVLVVYNCFHFIKYDKDMGLRDNASEHLRILVPRLILKYEKSSKDVEYLVGDVLLNLIRRTIRDSNENVRSEGIRLLGEMVRQCSSAHQVLTDLSGLADVQDPEADFFENLTHLQSHRHGRALLKFCNMARTLTVAPNQRTLMQFIMPLASRYLLNEKHAGKHTLVDAAIEALGVVCQLLPWQHYQAVLKYYLLKLRTTQEHQKHCVRIVVRILDAFHFDLRHASGDKSALDALKEELKEKQDKAEDSQKNHENEEDSLDSDLDEIGEEEEEEVEEKPPLIPVLEIQTILQKNAAKRVMQTIATVLIPTLNRSITEKSSYDAKHKVNRKRFSTEREEEEIQRVPIGLALVKLMQKLPKEVLETSLSGVFMKVCTFLKSPLKSVRMLTRDILKKIMLTLGSSYLAMLLEHLISLLTRGFQVHVLSVTVHGVLDALRDIIKPGDIESCLGNILEVALNDIFGEIAAEKEVEKIQAHTPEAKPSSKSFLVLHIVARNIQESCLLDVLLPFKDYLAKSHSKKTLNKIQDCFQKIVTGLVENPYISRESLLIFIYGTISESIPDLLPGAEKRPLSENEKEKMRRARPDCYIIQPEPKFRAGAIRKNVQSSSHANVHILIEFGLEMLHIVLKRKKLVEIAYEPFLNPVLPLIRDSLKSTHIRVTTFALKCVTSIWNEGYELPELKNYLEDIVTRLFEILHSFSTFGATKQEENFQLMKNAFKCVVALLRKCDGYVLNSSQIEQLVFYAEHDLHEGGNQTMAFSLLKAMVNRKVESKEMHDIMLKLREITIVSQSDFARDESRAIVLTYMMEYVLKNRVDTYIKFFTRQLSYSVASGRLSAIKFLKSIVTKFPLDVLAKKAEFLFISFGTRLVNDEMPECRKAIAECIELLIARMERETRQKLFDVVLLFFEADKPSIREMAAMLCSRFLVVENDSFEPRVKVVLPILVSRLMFSNPNAPGRFVRAPDVTLNLDEVETNQEFQGNGKKRRKMHSVTLTDEQKELYQEKKQREIDHEVIQMQHCILKILEYCPEILDKDAYSLTADELAYESQKLLGYEHEWVRVNSAKILAQILSTYDFALISAMITKKAKKTDKHRDYIYLNPENDIKSLVLDLCAQVLPGETNPQMMDEIVKIFLFVANMLRDVPFDVVKVKKEEDEDCKTDRSKINLNWLVKNMRFLVNKELALAPHSCIARTAIFTLTEGFITLLETEIVTKLGLAFLSILVREMSEEDQNVDADLRQLAIRVGNKLRKRIGSDVYDKLRSTIQMKLMMRRAKRKKLIAQEKVNDPVRAAKRKQGIQERKKATKKRKVDVIRGKAEGKKKRKRKQEEDIF